MKNRTLLLLLVILVLLFASCSTVDSVKTNEVITIKASDKANLYTKLLIQKDVRGSFKEENFPLEREKLMQMLPQTFPEAEVSGKLEKETFDGCDVYTLSNGTYENIVYYIHGGAWVYGIDPSHVTFCDDLAKILNAKVYMPLYPLAPEYQYQDTYKMIYGFYEKLLEQGKPIFVMGDSAGGTITLGLINLIKQNKNIMPQRVVALHPCTDLTFSNEEIKNIEPSDPMLVAYGCLECAKMWAGDTKLSDKALSANSRNLKNYPKTLLFIGTNDILYPDALIFYDKMVKAGNDITLVKGEDLWHVFSIFDGFQEKEESLKIISDFCLK